MTDRERLINEENKSYSRYYGSFPSIESLKADTENFKNFNDAESSTLKYHQKIGYSLGHVFNDFCAGIWFSYTLLFLKSVVALKDSKAGAMVS